MLRLFKAKHDIAKEFPKYAAEFVQVRHLRRDMLKHSRSISHEMAQKADLLRTSNWTIYQIIAYLTNLYQVMYGDDLCLVAAEYGDLSFIQLLFFKQYQTSCENIAKVAVANGHKHILKWIFETTGSVYQSSYRAAVFSGRKDVTEYLNGLQEDVRPLDE